MNLETIIKASVKEIFVFWSEISHINSELGASENFYINKAVSLEDFELLVREAVKFVEPGCDKAKIEIRLNDGAAITELLDLTNNHKSVVDLIKDRLEESA